MGNIGANTVLDTDNTPLTVSEGGTGLTGIGTNGNEVICAGTTSTGPLQIVLSSGVPTNYLMSNGAGALPSFATPAGAFYVQDLSALPAISPLFGASGTYTPSNAQINNILVELIGGGGAGGGAAQTTASHFSCGGGGASGGYVRKWIPNIGPTYTATFATGAGGTAGTAGNHPGNNGGASTWSDGTFTLSACGGTGGAGMASSAAGNISAGGAVGTSTGGDLNSSGAAGQPGVGIVGTATGGAGGSCMYASGAQYNVTANSAGTTGGIGFGGGGSGAQSVANATDRAGGAGRLGIVIVYEFY